MNAHQISNIALTPGDVDCIVFWTKNPCPDFINNLYLLDEAGYTYYVQYTLTPYGREIEQYMPSKAESVEKFIALSARIGKKKIIWRYDPILLTGTISADNHRALFEHYAEKLAPHTEKCVISFIDVYPSIKNRLTLHTIQEPDDEQSFAIARGIQKTARTYRLKVETCAEHIDLSAFDIAPGHCIDGNLINAITGKRRLFKKDKNQRAGCGCAESVDIGAYHTCRHGCVYCYANRPASAEGTGAPHDDKSPLLCSRITAGDTITNRVAGSRAAANHDTFEAGLF
jgi:hypothetical protein